MAAYRSTREGEVKSGREIVPCIIGTPMAGERIADVTFDNRKIRMWHQMIAEPLDVECDDLMALSQQLGNQNTALVATRTSDEDFHIL